MKRVFIGLASVLICSLFLGILSFCSIISDAKDEAARLENISLNISQVADGVYEGHSEIGPVIVDVEVTVQNGIIENIEILQHQNGMGQAANGIIDDMLKNNTYDVDAVTGATISSKVIINAVNDALQKGLE